MSAEEKTPLMSSVASAADSSAKNGSGGSDASAKYDSNTRKNFYFLQKTGSHASDSPKRTSGDAKNASGTRDASGFSQARNSGSGSGPVGGVLSSVQAAWIRMFQWGQPRAGYHVRKVPVKIEPKVFFANERTFLAWLHMSVTLATISIAIVAFAEANDWSMIYGLLMMPVAIAFCCYSLWLYITRANMIRRKDPGPYENRTGPIVLASLLGFSILVNFFIKLHDITSAPTATAQE